jgi:hypothetical protein
MPHYKLTGTGIGGCRTKEVDSATMADAWVEEFKDKGSGDITIERDGVFIKVEDLPNFIKAEHDAFKDSR